MLKDLIQWNYPRGTWVYDVFCLLIVAFIFLTPKAWFEKPDLGATRPVSEAVKERASLLYQYHGEKPQAVNRR